MLKVLLQHPRQPLSRDKLMALARGREQGPFDRAIDVQISRLRKLIESDPAQPRYLQTVWGFGYVFVPDGAERAMIPRTLLARTFLLLAALVILTTTAWLSLFRYIEAEPRARETAQLAASAVNLIRAALFAAAPEKRPELFNELSTREGIRLLPAEADDRIEPMPDSRFYQLIQRELSTRLGPHTRIAAEVDGVAGFWVSFRLDDHDEEEYWLILPRERAMRSVAGHWLLWGLLALALALAVAWLIASRISRPLKAHGQVRRSRRSRPQPDTAAGIRRRGNAAAGRRLQCHGQRSRTA